MELLLDTTQPAGQAALRTFSLLDWMDLSLVCKATRRFLISRDCFAFHYPTAKSLIGAFHQSLKQSATIRHARYTSINTVVLYAIRDNTTTCITPPPSDIMYYYGIVIAHGLRRYHNITHWEPSPSLYLLFSLTNTRAARQYAMMTGVRHTATLFYAVTRQFLPSVLPLNITTEDKLLSIFTLILLKPLNYKNKITTLLQQGIIRYDEIFSLMLLTTPGELNNFLTTHHSTVREATLYDSPRLALLWSSLHYPNRRVFANTCRNHFSAQGFVNAVLLNQSPRYLKECCTTNAIFSEIVLNMRTIVGNKATILYILQRATQAPLGRYAVLIRGYLTHCEEEVLRLVDALAIKGVASLPVVEGSLRYTAYSRYYNSRGWHPYLHRLVMLSPETLINNHRPPRDFKAAQDPLYVAYTLVCDGRVEEAQSHGYVAMLGIQPHKTPYKR